MAVQPNTPTDSPTSLCGSYDDSAPLPPMDPSNPIRVIIPEGNPGGLPPTMLVHGADNLEELTSRELNCLDMCLPSGSQMIMGPNGLAVVVGDNHPKLKKDVSEMFSDERISACLPIIGKHIRAHIEKWLQEGDNGKEVISFNVCQDSIYDIYLELAFGCRTDDPKYDVMKQAIRDAGAVLTSIPTTDPDSDFQKGMAGRRILDEYMDGMIHQYKTTVFKRKAVNALTFLLQLLRFVSKYTGNQTWVEMYIEISREEDGSIDSDKVKDGIAGLIFAGNLSPPGLFTNLVHLIGTHPDVKRNIREELKKHGFMDKGTPVSLEDLLQLDYISNCIREALRMVPVVAAGFRKVLHNQTLGGYRLPKDYSLLYHYGETLSTTNSKLKDGSKYIPDRWLPDNIKKEAESASSPSDMTVEKLKEPGQCHWSPFGIGKRSCVAEPFGIAMAAMFIVELVTIADWEVLNPNAPMTLRPVAMPNDFVPAVFHRL